MHLIALHATLLSMGRVLTPERRYKALAYWRERICRLDRSSAAALRRSLVGLFGPDCEQALTRSGRPSPPVLALKQALESLSHGETTALDTWIKRHLVQRGADLLISEEARKAALSAVRNFDHRAALALKPKAVLLRVSPETANKLKAYAKNRRAPGPEAAINLLLKEGAARTTPKKSPSSTTSRSSDLGQGKIPF